MEFTQSLQVSANSAIGTLQVIDRQSRKDIGKILVFVHKTYILATSPAALKAYRQTWKSICQLCEIIWLILCLLFSLLEQWSDRQVTQYLPQEIEAQDPGQVASTEESAIATAEPIEVAAPIAEVAEVARVETIATDSGNSDWAKLDPSQLRKECQKSGIRWRNANGKNRHMSKTQMVEALGAIAFTA